MSNGCCLSQVIDWMGDRLKSASDESYKDPTNIRSKLLKHKVFEAELEANKIKIDALKRVFIFVFGTKYSRMEQVKFVEDSL